MAARLREHSDVRMAAIGSDTAVGMEGVDLRRYPTPSAHAEVHPFARRFDAECRRAEQVMFAALALKAEGFDADIVVAHCGWGESLPLREVFKTAKLVVYCEFYYRSEGQDVGFDPETGRFGLDGLVALAAKNAQSLLALADCDLGLSPTPWQKSTFPPEFQSKIHVSHEGVDTRWIAPDATARFDCPGGPVFDRDDEVVTYFARDFEPMRGFHVFMRALPSILREQRQAHIVLVGGDGVSYGNLPEEDTNWKQHSLREILPDLDLTRVHFLDRLPHSGLRRLMQVSRVHVYLTYPFVLSWSCIEALASGCAIVASDTAPVRDVIVDGENGVLAPFHDHEAIAARVCELLRDAPRRARIGGRARETAVLGFDVQACVDRTLQLIGLDGVTRVPVNRPAFDGSTAER